MCQLCALEIEDEGHMLLRCPAYEAERQSLLDEVCRISHGQFQLRNMHDNVRLRFLIGCGCMDNLYVPIVRAVAHFLVACFAYRARFLLLSVRV